MTLTFIDAGVLIAAARGDTDVAIEAIRVLDDADREFVSSIFVQFEVLPTEKPDKPLHRTPHVKVITITL